MKALYKMTFDYGRMGELEGVFVAEKEYIDYLTSHKIMIYFGEVLGKHSEVCGWLEESEVKLITDDEKVISIVEEYGLESGYDPLYQTLGQDTEGLEDTDIDWDDCTVKEYIDYKLHGTIPNFD